MHSSSFTREPSMNSRDDEVWSGRESAARNLNRFFMLDVLRQWTFMIENRIREPAMTLSPWVLMSTMLMCCHAVGAETLDRALEDIERAAHFDGRYSRELINDLQAGYRAILRKIRAEQRQDFLQISHSIWIPSELPFENQYAVNVAQSVGAQIFRAHDMSSTALHSWVQNQVQEYELQCDFPSVSSSKVVMLSLLRLSTTWTHPFDGKYTEKHTIFCPDVSMNSVQRLDLMVQRNTFPYHENAHFKAVSLSTNSTLECLCILPTGSLHSLLKSLSEDNGFLFKPMKGEKRKLVVKMPSFRIAEGDDISEVLEHTFIFRRLLDIQAHYSRMTKAKTSIRHIIHKNLLSITEAGINTRGTQQCVRSEILKPEPNEQILEFSKSFVFLVRDRERCDIVLATVVHGTYPLSPRQANLRPTTHSAGALSPRQTNLRPTTYPASAAHLYAPTSLGPRTPTDKGTTALPPSAREEAVISALMAAENARVAAAAAQQKLRMGGGGSGWEMLLGPQLESTRIHTTLESTSTNMPLPHDSAVSRPPNNGSVYMNGQQQSTHMNGQQQSMTPATKGARVILSPVIFSEEGEQMEWKRVKEWSGERRRGETNGEDTLEVLGTEGGHLPQKMTVGDDDWAALMREQRARAHLASPLSWQEEDKTRRHQEIRDERRFSNIRTTYPKTAAPVPPNRPVLHNRQFGKEEREGRREAATERGDQTSLKTAVPVPPNRPVLHNRQFGKEEREGRREGATEIGDQTSLKTAVPVPPNRPVLHNRQFGKEEREGRREGATERGDQTSLGSLREVGDSVNHHQEGKESAPREWNF